MKNKFLKLLTIQLVIWIIYRIVTGSFWCLNHPTELNYLFINKLYQFLVTDVIISLLIVLFYYVSKKYAQTNYLKAVSFFLSLLISFIMYFCIVSIYFRYIRIVEFHKFSFNHFIFASNYYWLLFIILNVSNYIYDFCIEFKKQKIKNSELLLTIQDSQKSHKYESKLYLSHKTYDNYIQVSTIKFIQADTYISNILTNQNKKISVHISLKRWEDKLPKDKFFRIHKSFIVNLDYVERISKLSNQTYEVYIKDQKTPLKMSRRLGKEFISKAKI